MTKRTKMKDSGGQIRAGFLFLGLASLAKLFLERTPAISHHWADGLIGLLYGVSCALMLCGVWKNSRGGSEKPAS